MGRYTPYRENRCNGRECLVDVDATGIEESGCKRVGDAEFAAGGRQAGV